MEVAVPVEVLKARTSRLPYYARTRIISPGNAEDPPSVNINGKVRITPTFQYLGSIVSRQVGCEDDIKQHIGKAAGVINSLHKHL